MKIRVSLKYLVGYFRLPTQHREATWCIGSHYSIIIIHRRQNLASAQFQILPVAYRRRAMVSTSGNCKNNK